MKQDKKVISGNIEVTFRRYSQWMMTSININRETQVGDIKLWFCGQPKDTTSKKFPGF